MKKQKDFYQISLKVILQNDVGETLVLGGQKGGAYEGYYDLPGGRIDRDEFEESLENIIKRELREEIGDVSIEIDSHPVALGRHALTNKDENGNEVHVLYVFFTVQYKGGEISLSQEHTSATWLVLRDNELETYFKSGILEGIKTYLKE